jgi:hypothetical protein
MFILPKGPSPEAETHELADFAELLCLEKGQTSAREIVAYLGRIDDNDNNLGCEDDDDENADALDDAMNEIDRRAKACGSGYPFLLEREGTALQYDGTQVNQRASIYLYLLLSTRLNMKDSRVHNGIDGAHLLEELAAHVLRNYLGGTKASSIIFGTSVGGGFKERVESMCEKIREGAGFRSIDNAPVAANDDKLDAVAWVPFSDGLAGQLVVFGQCKTGSNWGGLVDQLQPENFIKKWMREPFLVNPLRAFCISEAADRSRWKGTCVSTGILLDRCRLVDFSDNASGELMARIERWTRAARKTLVMPRSSQRVRRSSRKKPTTGQ